MGWLLAWHTTHLCNLNSYCSWASDNFKLSWFIFTSWFSIQVKLLCVFLLKSTLLLHLNFLCLSTHLFGLSNITCVISLWTFLAYVVQKMDETFGNSSIFNSSELELSLCFLLEQFLCICCLSVVLSVDTVHLRTLHFVPSQRHITLLCQVSRKLQPILWFLTLKSKR